MDIKYSVTSAYHPQSKVVNKMNVQIKLLSVL